jgi:serine/threonine-protein kinase RsbW
MQSHDRAAAHGLAPGESARRRPEVAELDAACRRQADVIDRLTSALTALRRGYAALKAENLDLRSAVERPGGTPDRTEVRLPLDARAAGAARLVVTQCLEHRVPTPTLDNATLVMSELVTNSVRHSHQAADRGVVIRVQVSPPAFRLEVQDGGHDGVIAPRTPDPVAGSGYGLAVVERLSERWGLERSVDTGTRVWAQLPRGPVLA